MATTNRLADETSPYLRQHATNPVDWYPWGEEAFAAARQRDVPILLSVGYSACHWCHVMAHESFEDPVTASLVNDRFVAVKVDREERPDVDALSLEAVQAISGQGGWPMTVFLTPDGRPFYGGTYYPHDEGRGLPSFRQVLGAMDGAWRDRRADVLAQSDQLTQAVASASRLPAAATGQVRPPSGETGLRTIQAALDAAEAAFDRERGGFGRAPKFPQPALLDLLARLAAAPVGPDPAGMAARATAMLRTTLAAMAAGGIRDHLGGGFARYSTDSAWLVPHFEKMGYDQAGLARVYLHGWQVTGDETWRRVATETLAYLSEGLADQAGGLHSAEDADSGGGEGRYYLWRPEELEEVLGSELAAEAAQWWGVTARGNFEGASILHRPSRSELELPEPIERARELLLAARSRRPRPGRDDKVLTEWNAMAVSTLAEAAGATGEEGWLRAAERIAGFLCGSLRREDGRWLRSWRAGRASHLAYAGDHAWLVDAFTRLGEATGLARWTELAVDTADRLLELFWDEEDGGFFTSGSDAERLVVRTKEPFDGAIPSASSAAAFALDRLGVLTGRARYQEAATRVLASLADVMERAPTAAGHALAALHGRTAGFAEVVVTGDRPDLVETLRRRFLPAAVLAWGEPFPSPLWHGRGDGAAYVCHGYACGLPACSAAELEEQIGALGRAAPRPGASPGGTPGGRGRPPPAPSGTTG
ncbi:MAG: thioredoxin domain-containing protein [Acidimicrobiales bacterium]